MSNIDDIPNNEALVVQRYIDNPHTLNGTKYDVRIHVLVTSVNPLSIYLLDDGHIRMATMKYEQSDLKNVYKHLTNWSLNKNHKDFKQTTWNLKDLVDYLDKNGLDSKKALDDMKDALVKTFILAEEDLYECNKNNTVGFLEVKLNIWDS